MLEIRDLHVYYGGVHALKSLSIDVPDGKVVTLLGANGAGKSTTLRTICGLVKPKSGEILFDGQRITGQKPFQIARAGIAMVPEGRRVFGNLSVYENLIIATDVRAARGEIEGDMERIFAQFPILKKRLAQKAGTLSGGEQQMLAFGRALMSRPKLLLLDEPTLGLAPKLVAELFETIARIHAEGMTILLVEQNARAALGVTDYGYILEIGQVTLEGPGEDLIQDDSVRRVYLGIT